MLAQRKKQTTTIIVQSHTAPAAPATFAPAQPNQQTVIVNTMQPEPNGSYVVGAPGPTHDLEKAGGGGGKMATSPALPEYAERDPDPTIRTARTGRRGGPMSVFSRSEHNASVR
jgi:hypothetical protein